MRIFCASVATETNTFSPLKTDMTDFEESFYAAPGEHPETPTLCSAVFPVCRRRARAENWTLIEGTATWAEPGGLINAATWEYLRNEILEQVQAALPLDGIILGLHGAMVAQTCDDCEGDLLSRIREVAGPDVVIGATLDPHSHLTRRRLEAADILIAFKEFPHTDFVDCAESCVDLTLRAARGEIKPRLSAFDCRMIEVMPTNAEPMRGFVDQIKAHEGRGSVLSVSIIHGFMAADVPDIGAHIMVITDDHPELGAYLARDLGMQLFDFRGRTKPQLLSAGEALEQAQNAPGGPVVIADIWDNPGGGVPGDSTILTKLALDRQMTSLAVGSIWDPMAVRICMSAGEGARLFLRFGGKTSATAGAPIDAEVEIFKLVRNAEQSFGQSRVPLGDAAAIRVDGIEVVLNSVRSQAFSPDLFSNLGIDPSARKILIVKSTNHFRGAFEALASDILYVSIEGLYPSNPLTNGYRKLTRPVWPIVENPHAELESA
ncbi:M81 family metallopeptidase [Denitrobaculum tricleocarpae]|uniref:Microcystinase C n=1 Tax=Denitrobaculum tricleocarpae TaxID=2591009 RepID=A0A545U1Q0_9PROT|nr:M81 family metallopeptidase [Denitrobaculum tricleocarpae]TQV83364.1 M81 family metallopeptidase [Denitrobaculum tricleocarpae]